MNNSKIVNDDVITVVPRIIDPNMKFTKESIQNIELKNKNVTCKIENISTNDENSIKDENIQNSINIGFFAKYKTYIFVIIIIILLICIIYLIYKYVTNKKKKEIENENTFNKDDKPKEIENTNNVLKKKEINNYLSNFILDEDEDEENQTSFSNTNLNLDNNKTNLDINYEIPVINEPIDNSKKIVEIANDNKIVEIFDNNEIVDNTVNSKNTEQLNIEDSSLYRIGEDSDEESIKSMDVSSIGSTDVESSKSTDVESLKSTDLNEDINTKLNDNLEKNDLDYFKKFVTNSS